MKWLRELFRGFLARFRPSLPTIEVEIVAAPNPRQHVTAGGSPKVAYRNKEMANAGRKRLEARTGKAFAVYQCQICPSWHIGSKQ